MKRPVKFAGFDIESTGSTPGVHQVIQVGLAPREFLPGIVPQPVDRHDFGSLVSHPAYRIVPEAMEVNKLPLERFMRAPSAHDVDVQLAAVLAEFNPEGRVTPIGWNVGSFDVQMIRGDFPRTAQHLGYHAIDLNTLCYALAAAHEALFADVKTGAKLFARAEAAKYGMKDDSHDALFDARMAVLEYYWLVARIHEGDF